MIEWDKYREESMKLANDVGFFLHGKNMISGILALVFCLDEILKQQQFFTLDDICDLLQEFNKGGTNND